MSTISTVSTVADAAELVGLFETVFGTDDTHLWRAFHGREPYYRPEWSRVVREGGRIVSHACWVPRRIRIGRTEVRAGAVGYVATHPDFRGRGLAAALLEEWTRDLTYRGEHVSFVTGIPGFYERFGYDVAFPFDGWDAAVSIGGIEPTAGELRVRPFREGDLPALASLYNDDNAERTGSLVRTEEYWRWLLEGLQATGRVLAADVLVVEDEDGAAAGYAFVHAPTGERLELWEAAARDGRAARSLLAAVRAASVLRSRLGVDLMLPLDHAVTRLALSLGGQLSGYTYGIYARILSLEGLFAALEPELQGRARNSPVAEWSGTIRLATDIGTIDFALSAGELRIGERFGRTHAVEIPQSLLVKLITGYASVRYGANMLSVRQLADEGGTGISAPLLPVLGGLFPKGCPYMWLADTGY